MIKVKDLERGRVSWIIQVTPGVFKVRTFSGVRGPERWQHEKDSACRPGFEDGAKACWRPSDLEKAGNRSFQSLGFSPLRPMSDF